MSNVGFRVFKKIHRPDPALIEKYRGMPVANIGDVMHRTACFNSRIKPLNSAVLVGPAITVRVRRGDNLMLHHVMDMAQPGDVIVVDGMNDLSNSLAGENMMNWCAGRGIAGVVVDGAMRDVDALSKMNFPVYCSGAQPNGPYKNGPGEINVPIKCGDVPVMPGDLIVGDADGVVAIPRLDAEEIFEKVMKKNEYEEKTAQAIKNRAWDRPGYTEEALRKMGCEFIDDYYSDHR